jgi:hypothetical protein
MSTIDRAAVGETNAREAAVKEPYYYRSREHIYTSKAVTRSCEYKNEMYSTQGT